MFKTKTNHCFNQSHRFCLLHAQLIMLACVVLAAMPTVAEVHPYQKWADEFGIDLNASYDGTRTMEMKDGTFEFIEHKAPGKMYTQVQMGNISSGVILREDLGKGFLLMTSMGMYKETSLDEGMMQSSNGMEFSSIEKVGRDEISGWPSTKFKTRFKDNNGKGAGHIWITDQGVPIKMDMIYASGGEKGQRLTMQFTELHMRDQDPAIFELPDGLKPMNLGGMAGLSGILSQSGQQAPAQPEPSTQEPATNKDMSAEQRACLEESARLAEEKKESTEKKKKFGRLLGAVSRTANRFGMGNMNEVTRDVYSANASAEDIKVIADGLGITPEDVERCRNPS